MTALSRNRQLTVSATSASDQATGWILLKHGGVVTIEGGGTNPFVLERKGADGTVVTVTDNSGSNVSFTSKGTYTLDPAETPALYRLNQKANTYVSGTSTVMIEGR